jgi:hypothetical protein
MRRRKNNKIKKTYKSYSKATKLIRVKMISLQSNKKKIKTLYLMQTYRTIHTPRRITDRRGNLKNKNILF